MVGNRDRAEAGNHAGGPAGVSGTGKYGKYCYPGYPLNRPELKIGEALLQGLANEEIAVKLQLTCDIVKSSIWRMSQKLFIFSGDSRVRVALALHERRLELGIRCPCDYRAPA